jgi:hypothetical protein
MIRCSFGFALTSTADNTSETANKIKKKMTKSKRIRLVKEMIDRGRPSLKALQSGCTLWWGTDASAEIRLSDTSVKRGSSEPIHRWMRVV